MTEKDRQLQGISPWEEQPLHCDSCGTEEYPSDADESQWSFPRNPEDGPLLCPDCANTADPEDATT